MSVLKRKLLELINQGATKWNSWREENQGEQLDLGGMDLRFYNLTQYDFSKVNMKNTNFHGAILNNVNFSQGNLVNTDFGRSYLSIANFSNSDVSSSIFNGAFLSGANFQNAILENNDFRNAFLENSKFTKANLKGGNFDGVDLTTTILENADLSFATLSRSNLSYLDLTNTKLFHSDFYQASLVQSSFKGMDLQGCKFERSILWETDFSSANLEGVNFSGADLRESNFSNSNLQFSLFVNSNLYRSNFKGANLKSSIIERAACVECDFTGANLNGTHVYGVAAWDLKSNGAFQKNLVISKYNDPVITVDDLEVAQFIYLILNNDKIRNVLETVSKKGVLILGRFTPERKKVLDSIREKLRVLNYLPIMFDFEKVQSKDFTETIKILAGMSRFVIADITNPSSSPLELQATLPNFKIPFQPIIQSEEKEFAMFKDLTIYPWCMELLEYDSEKDLMEFFELGIIHKAIEKEAELLKVKEQVKTSGRNIRDI